MPSPPPDDDAIESLGMRFDPVLITTGVSMAAVIAAILLIAAGVIT